MRGKRRFARAFILMLGAILFCHGSANATWNQIFQFGNTASVSAIYFISVDTGFVGFTGSSGDQIERTTDGGLTWTSVIAPALIKTNTGWVSDIWFRDHKEGWASFEDQASASSLWHTTDGGQSWLEAKFFGSAISVRQTSRAVIVTQYVGSGISVSTDGGRSFPTTFATNKDGIEFVDDVHGVVSGYVSNFYYTADGGLTWQASNANFSNEAWNVYGLKGTSTFIAAPEDQSIAKAPSNVYVSADYGANWKLLQTLPFKTTGEIRGDGSAVYVQVKYDSTVQYSGLYRSLDFGLTWTSIQGPSNGYDTRFAVLQCGNIIYALDPQNNLYKSDDAGDGTPLSGERSFALATPSIDFGVQKPCATPDTMIVITNNGCGVLDVQKVSISGTGFTVLSRDTIARILRPGQRDTLHVTYDGITTGVLSATVKVVTDADVDSIRTITIQAYEPQANRVLEVNTTTLDFGTIRPCSGKDTTLILTNRGCLPLAFHHWSVQGNGFEVSGTPGVTTLIRPGMSDTVLLSYIGGGVGPISGTVTIGTDADSAGTRTIALRGNALPGTRLLSIDTTAIDFGLQPPCSTEQIPIIYSDTGCSQLEVRGASISGSGFVLSRDTSMSGVVNPGASDTLRVALDGTNTGAASAVLTLHTNADHDSVRTIALHVTSRPVDSVRFKLSTSRDTVLRGDTVTVFITPDRTYMSAGLHSIRGTLTYNSDTHGYLSSTSPSPLVSVCGPETSVGSVGRLPFTITQAPDILLAGPTQPILSAKFITRLSDSLETTFSVDGIELNDADPVYASCTLASSASSTISHVALAACSDDIMVRYLRGQPIIFSHISPNPVTAEDGYWTALRIQSPFEGTARLVLFDALGRQLSTSMFSVSANDATTFPVDFSHCTAGSYFYTVEFACANGVSRTRGAVNVVR